MATSRSDTTLRVPPRRGLWWLGLLMALVATGPVVAADITDPGIACALLEAHGLKTRGEVEEGSGDGFRCASIRKSLPLGGEPAHEIRYFVLGRAGRAQSLNLQLTINSRLENQAAHRRLLEYTTALMHEALGVEPPAEMSAAILSGLNGRFQVGGRNATVTKGQIRGPLYELTVSLETGA